MKRRKVALIEPSFCVLTERATIISREESNEWLIINRGATYQEMGNHEQALADFEKAITADQNDGHALMHRGETYREVGQHEKALADFDRAIVLGERSLRLYNSRGSTYLKMGEYEEAVADFDRALSLDESSIVHANRGETYRQMEEYEKALADFDQAIVLGYDSYNTRGLTLSYLGRYSEALSDYEHELKENPNSISALYNIAVVMSRWKGFPVAQTYVDRAYEAMISVLDTEQHSSALYGLGGLEAIANNFEQALDYLQQAILLNNNVLDWARHDIAWSDLRTSDPNFQSLIFER